MAETPRVRRWAKRALLLLLAAYLGFVFGVAPYWLAGMATTRRYRYRDTRNEGLTPASFDLPFEDLTFRAADGVSLEGWWVPAPEERGTVILAHGLNRTRVEMVGKVPFLHARGWNALALDLRQHGSSGGSLSSFGHFEKQDVAAAAALARSRSNGPLVYWGVSLGGATVALAAAEDPSVAGVICDSSYRSLRDTVTHHLRLFRRFRWWLRIVPAWPVADEAVFWIGRRGGFDPDAVDIVGAARRLADRPTLFVCNSGDRRIPKEIAFELEAAAGDAASVLVIPGESHGGAYRTGQAAYESAVAELLDRVLAASDGPGHPPEVPGTQSRSHS